MARIPLIASLFAGLLLAEFCSAQLQVPPDEQAFVPHRLLALLHAPEVHAELKLTQTQITALEKLFHEVDGDWFRSRIQSAEKQYATHQQLQQRVTAWIRQHCDATQQKRVKHLECRAQGVRCLLRKEIGEALELTPTQRGKFVQLAEASHAAQTELQQAARQQQPTEELQAAAQAAAQAEREAISSVLTLAQQQTLGKLLGEDFDTKQLTRVFPMAPELVPSEHWINSQPLTLKALRGKIVLLHFYAFQCHNCHANFDVYRRWHDQLRDKGVVVLGIQTPETATERRVDAVSAAAREAQLEFPILVDLESKNWQAWANTMWPTVYVVDRNGYLRHWWQGELRWQGATGDQTIESIVDRLLAESETRPIR